MLLTGDDDAADDDIVQEEISPDAREHLLTRLTQL